MISFQLRHIFIPIFCYFCTFFLILINDILHIIHESLYWWCEVSLGCLDETNRKLFTFYALCTKQVLDFFSFPAFNGFWFVWDAIKMKMEPQRFRWMFEAVETTETVDDSTFLTPRESWNGYWDHVAARSRALITSILCYPNNKARFERIRKNVAHVHA